MPKPPIIYAPGADNHVGPLFSGLQASRPGRGSCTFDERCSSAEYVPPEDSPKDNGANNIFSDYRQFLKAGTIPNPSGLFVTLDEHPDSINDGYFQTDPHPTSAAWNDLPATYHDGAGGFAFADGHSEVHKFKSRACTILPVTYQTHPSWPAFSADTSGAGAADGAWVETRASVPLN